MKNRRQKKQKEAQRGSGGSGAKKRTIASKDRPAAKKKQKRAVADNGVGDTTVVNDEDVEFDEGDIEFVQSLGKSSHGATFLHEFERADFKDVSVPRSEEEDGIMDKYESKPRKSKEEGKGKDEQGKARVPLLPVKNLEGGVEAAIEIAESARESVRVNGASKSDRGDLVETPRGSGEAGGDPAEGEGKAAKKQPGGRVSRVPPKPEDYPAIKRKIAICSVSAIEKPESKGEENLGVLLDFARLQDHQVCQLAMLSLQAVFKDILPSYKIKSIDESDMNLSKDVRKQHNYESMLLRTYQAFLRILFKKNKSGVKEVKVAACKCLCNLLRSNYNFNYRSDILKQVIPLMNSKFSDVSALCLDCVEQLFRIDKDGEATLEVLQLIADYIRKNDCMLNGGMIEIMKVIRLSDDLTRKLLQAEEDDSVHLSRKEKQRRANEKRRKRDAALREGRDVDYHLGTATQGVKEKMKIQTKIIEGMFECVFRVLKNFKDGIVFGEEEVNVKKDFSWPLLSSTLSCLAKFCMYINIDFMKDLFNWLYTICNEDAVPRSQKFQCLNCVYQILDGPGKALNIDTLRFDTTLYELALKEKFLPRGLVEKENQANPQSVVAQAIQAALLHRRVMDRKRVINFMKRICMCSLSEACSDETLGSVHLVARLLQRYVSTRALLENDEVNSVYTYSDFEGTLDLHGRNTCPLWELSLLGKHYHPHVASSVGTVISSNTSDLLKDPSSILNVNDVGELFEEYGSRMGRFNPAPPRRPSAKAKSQKGNSCILVGECPSENEVKEDLTWLYLGRKGKERRTQNKKLAK
ncbi:nucleolar complex protein [Chloropicon primus]|uniref:Nucleolar complex protein n=2 Tax=Chloropicon primus TaxID=1764295 RepID=A0A5B8MIU0_9CHLO|nr:nucleolar complex protein [Chloropicon primus]UPQ99509.1 nucleolar complex protein [Chloropicon primus]|eukprot:QDZ20299.1 nucleolar complex protein [Chloropicon primus]